MGFSWSLFFSQKINEYQCSLTSSLSSSHLISDKGEPVVFRSEACRVDPSSSMRHYVYVDNLGVLSPHEAVVSKSLQELDEHFTERGLLLHPGEVKTGNVKALGTILDGKNKCSKVSPERFHRVRQAVRGVLRRAKISGKCLEVVIGHCTFCGLNNRLTLSIFHSCYKFIQACYYEPVPLWTSARDELRAFAGLMIFLRAEWWRPWNNLVCCSDASKVGFGICTSFWNKEDVAKVGRIKERTRFKRSSGHSARESALTNAGFVKDLITGDWKAGLIDGEQYLEQSGWTLDETFEEVPAKHLHHDLWEPKLWGRWKYDDDIIVLEARAAVKALRRVALSVFGVHVRQLFLLDNMSLVLALDRCRSRQHKLLKQVRIFCAYCLARGIQPAVRWIPSELNASDEPSRYGTSESSKLLTSLIPSHGTKEEPSPGPTTESEARGVNKFKDSAEGVRVDSGQKRKAAVLQPAPLEEKLKLKSVSPVCKGLEEMSVDSQPTTQQADSVSSSSDSSSLGARTKTRTLAARKKYRRRKYVNQLLDGKSPQELTFLERKSVKPITENMYAKEYKMFMAFADHREMNLKDSNQVDMTLLEYEQDVRGRASGLRGRQAHRRLLVPPPGVQQGWTAAHSPFLEGTERLAKAVSRTEPKTISLVDLVRPGLPYGASRVPPNGSVCDAVPLYVQPTIGAFEMPYLQPDSTIPEHYQSMESSAESRGNGSYKQDRGLRCESDAGLPVPLDLGWAFAANHEEEISRAASLGLHLQSIPECLQEVQQDDADGALAVPFETQWSFSRQKSSLPESTRSSKTWTMAVDQIDSQIREISQASQELGDSAREDQDLLQPMRARSRGYHAWTKASAHGDLPRRNPKGHYVADLFSGKGGVANACEALGFRANRWDIRHGHQCDLTNRRVLRKLEIDIHKGRIIAMMMAPPCDSFSVARDRTKVIRSKEFPWGLPFGLTTKESEKIKLGNACFRSCFRLIKLLDRYHIPWILENPNTSKAWYLPYFDHLSKQDHIHVVTCDFCQYNKPWRKRTRFFTGNICYDDLRRIQLLCTGKHGICSRTRRPHFHLTGCNSHGQNWTAVAQPYPSKLCEGLAYALTAHKHYNTVLY